MTVADVVAALSMTYGVSLLPSNVIPSFPAMVRSDGGTLVAHWDEGTHSLDLFRPSYVSTFGLVIVLKRVDELPRTVNSRSAPP
jgi:hypothetical protein